MSIRLNLSILPNLNIQFWGQPFIASGRYSGFKHITDPKAADFTDRYHIYTDDQITYDEDNHVYLIDENTDGSSDYYIINPNFNFKTFKSNLVLRWEFIPGSNLYLVWSQNRQGFEPNGSLQLGSDLKTLYDAYPTNVFLIKFSYRFRL